MVGFLINKGPEVRYFLQTTHKAQNSDQKGRYSGIADYGKEEQLNGKAQLVPFL
ncbi:hypothetical protein DFP94_11272 [Fontibacillus phaseoli]|uniref:Uncharacterized protein n=1 Tax=Fontibacillus phaseoli TaxID=1416533 RepID=A0A369B4H8_9BACL|nr:hypothetical protein DFP94_11272 [Fontibacillus phaseoli]